MEVVFVSAESSNATRRKTFDACLLCAQRGRKCVFAYALEGEGFVG